MSSQTSSILSKLKTLIKKDKKLETFGAEDGHLFKLNEPLSQEAMQAWETEYKLSLPADYREFLTTIANGGVGPFYGLYALQAGIDEAQNYATSNNETIENAFTQDFPISKKQADEFIQYYNQCLEDGEDDEIEYFKSFDTLTGVIFLAEYGCGWSYFLVVKGDLAGTVWFQGDYLSPCIDKDRIFNFAEWYENWLDDSLENLKPRKKADEFNISPTATIVNYDGWKLKEIPEKVFACTNLKKLVFSRNDLEKFPMEVLDFEQLRILDLSMTPIVDIPEEIGKLQNLKQLKLNYNYTLDLPKGLSKLQKLEKISMYYNYKLEKIPAVVGKIKSLKSLHFSYCSELKSIPENMGDLVNLEHLYLNDCQSLASLPESFGKLKSLKSLYLGSTKIQKLPESFSKLENLEYLSIDIASLDLADAIEKIKHLPKLHYLKISGQLDYPETLKHLTSVKTLLVSQNYDLYRQGHNFIPLHNHLTLIPNVEVLDVVNNNQASALPESIGNWQNLKELHLGATAIKAFPESLKQARNLSEVQGSLASGKNDTFGILSKEREKLKKWFPKAKILIW